MLAALPNDVLHVLLTHVRNAEDLAACAATCRAVHHAVFTGPHAWGLWAPHFGGARTLESAARAAAADGADGARGCVLEAHKTRRAALANWCSDDALVRMYDLTPTLPPTRMGATEALALDDDVLATGGSDHCIRVWDLRTGRDVHVLHGHRGSIRSLLVVRSRQLLVSGGWDKAIRCWDLRTGACTATVEGAHARCVMALALASENVLVSAGGEGTVAWWDLRELRASARVRTRRARAPVLALAVSPPDALGGTVTTAAYADGTRCEFVTPRDPAAAAERAAEPGASGASSDDGASSDESDADGDADAPGGAPGGGAAPPLRIPAVSSYAGEEVVEPVVEHGGPQSAAHARAAHAAPRARLRAGVRGAWAALGRALGARPAQAGAPADPLAALMQQQQQALARDVRGVVGAALADGAFGLCSAAGVQLAMREHAPSAEAKPPPPHAAPTTESPPFEHPRTRSLSVGLEQRAACMALLPDVRAAVVGCRPPPLPHARAPPAARVGAHLLLLSDASSEPAERRTARVVRLPLVISPSALLARWDVCVVGTQRGRVHLVDFAMRERWRGGVTMRASSAAPARWWGAGSLARQLAVHPGGARWAVLSALALAAAVLLAVAARADALRFARTASSLPPWL